MEDLFVILVIFFYAITASQGDLFSLHLKASPVGLLGQARVAVARSAQLCQGALAEEAGPGGGAARRGGPLEQAEQHKEHHHRPQADHHHRHGDPLHRQVVRVGGAVPHQPRGAAHLLRLCRAPLCDAVTDAAVLGRLGGGVLAAGQAAPRDWVQAELAKAGQALVFIRAEAGITRWLALEALLGRGQVFIREAWHTCAT